MRSFIKSHRKANSLDESPLKTSTSSGDLLYSQTSSVDPLVLVPTTPSHTSNNGNGVKYSPGFEPFHRLANKKMFTSKLFKKSSATNLNAQMNIHSSSPKESSSAPGTPQVKRWEGKSEHSSSNEDVSKFPAIKGTVTHSWGDQSKNTQTVIRLNNPSTSSSDGSDLEPAVRISSLRKGSVMSYSTTYSNENTHNTTRGTDDTQHRDKHIYNELSKVKSKNRQVRIHSHDDILHLEKSSAVSLQLLASTSKTPILHKELSEQEDSQNSVSSEEDENTHLNGLTGGLSTNEKSYEIRKDSGKDYLGTTRHTQGTSRSKRSDSERDSTSENLTPFDENDYDDDDDDASRFSFEINGINGRTSSIKYYSKPDPVESVYIDDMYEDENFDEDMNFYEDSFDDMEFPSNNINANLSPNTLPPSNNLRASALSTNALKPKKTYNDLLALSDDETDDDEEEVGDVDGTDHSALSDKNIERAGDHTSSNQQSNFDPENFEETRAELKNLSNRPLVASSLLHGFSPGPSSARFSSSVRNGEVKEKTTANIKSFSDIFNLDDGDDDSENDGIPGEISRSDYSSDDEEIESSRPTIYLNDNYADFKDNAKSSSAANDSESRTLPKTPVRILVSSPAEGANIKNSNVTLDPHLNINCSGQCLPRPARSQLLKFHDLSSNLDSEIPGFMSNLYFIDESEEDKYNEKQKIPDDDYIDEINTVPEDFDFSDSDQEINMFKSPLRKGSFRSTHSYSDQPTGVAKESTPTRNKLEIKNKTVTFFDHAWDRSPTEKQRPLHNTIMDSSLENDNYVISPNGTGDNKNNPVTPTNSFNKPVPEYLNEYSLSPIQESSTSVDNSPVRLR
ncbi:hypothetical protein HG535_0B02530 [Zygotorulaspora mrakii]|uniref:Zinc-regulated protein 8 n=1 Tax=Zygotorulaspora mrakii TaxID=42260 RepID=A0A7H9AYL6_ZYGMR|nr:uncharacterized protein HG535_0B02530 [Zygotorulaspora mrakii]QLG71214.1 hypothetical protein HG535_0B02530 [Zygotorulaspora mrakii]